MRKDKITVSVNGYNYGCYAMLTTHTNIYNIYSGKGFHLGHVTDSGILLHTRAAGETLLNNDMLSLSELYKACLAEMSK